nr:hypothetical protein [Nanoarchaeum sp.]
MKFKNLATSLALTASLVGLVGCNNQNESSEITTTPITPTIVRSNYELSGIVIGEMYTPEQVDIRSYAIPERYSFNLRLENNDVVLLCLGGIGNNFKLVDFKIDEGDTINLSIPLKQAYFEGSSNTSSKISESSYIFSLADIVSVRKLNQ